MGWFPKEVLDNSFVIGLINNYFVIVVNVLRYIDDSRVVWATTPVISMSIVINFIIIMRIITIMSIIIIMFSVWLFVLLAVTYYYY